MNLTLASIVRPCVLFCSVWLYNYNTFHHTDVNVAGRMSENTLSVFHLELHQLADKSIFKNHFQDLFRHSLLPAIFSNQCANYFPTWAITCLCIEYSETVKNGHCLCLRDFNNVFIFPVFFYKNWSVILYPFLFSLSYMTNLILKKKSSFSRVWIKIWAAPQKFK